MIKQIFNLNRFDSANQLNPNPYLRQTVVCCHPSKHFFFFFFEINFHQTLINSFRFAMPSIQNLMGLSHGMHKTKQISAKNMHKTKKKNRLQRNFKCSLLLLLHEMKWNDPPSQPKMQSKKRSFINKKTKIALQKCVSFLKIKGIVAKKGNDSITSHFIAPLLDRNTGALRISSTTTKM